MSLATLSDMDYCSVCLQTSPMSVVLAIMFIITHFLYFIVSIEPLLIEHIVSDIGG